MAEGESTRLVAWSNELRRVHERLREALGVARQAVRDGEDATTASHDLLLFCHGFCTALTAHHEGEDARLFPAIAAAHPELVGTLRKLEQDHAMMGHLITGLQKAVENAGSPADLEGHLEGIGAIMESHFRYEERELLTILADLDLEDEPDSVLGPL